MISTKYRNESSLNGYSLDILKSGLQKYVRRNKPEKGLWCLVELDLFNTLPDSPEVKRIRTNILNRLAIISTEDISVSAPGLCIKISKLHTKLKGITNFEERKKDLVKMYQLLLHAPQKARIISHLSAVFLLKTKVSISDEHMKCHKNMIASFPRFKKYSIHDVEAQSSQEAFTNLCKCLEEKSLKTFIWLHWFLRLEGNIKEIWNFILGENEEVKALHNLWKNIGSQERNIFLYHALLVLVRPQEYLEYEIPETNIEELYQKNLDYEIIKMESFVNDRHVKGGNKTMKFFVKNGAHVTNENTDFLPKEFKEFYELISIEKDHFVINEELESYTKLKYITPSLEVELLKLPRAQKLTSSHKKSVFVTKNYIIKGPYSLDTDYKKLYRNLEMVKQLNFFENELNLPEKRRSYIEWNKLLKNENNECYLVSKNVGKYPENIEDYVDIVSSKIEENVPVIRREAFVKRLSEIDLTKDYAITGLQHLYFRYILGIGDSGFHNILVIDTDKSIDTDKLIAGIDLEEERNVKTNQVFMMLFSRSSVNLRNTLKKYIKNIKQLKPKKSYSVEINHRICLFTSATEN